MRRVIERCPNCGVEHDDPKGGPCEVCGTTLRFWCRVHSKEIGWLDSEACPGCAAELSRPVPPPRPPAAPPPSAAPSPPPRPRRPAPTRVEADEPAWTEVPPRRPTRPVRRPRPWGGRDPRVVIMEGAEDVAPYAEFGASMAVRMVRAFFVVIGSVVGWGLVGAAVGFFFPDVFVMGGANPDPVWTVMAGAMVGGGFGLFIGTLRALRILFSQRRPPPR